MVKNLWKKIHLYCGNHKDDCSIEMKIHDGKDAGNAFYSCPKYYPDNREPGEKACVNHISVNDFEKMLNHIMEILVKGAKDNEEIDLTGYKWKDRYIDYHVLKYSDECINILCLNKRSIK